VKLEEFVDDYLIKTWLKKIVDIFNYNDGDNWRRDM
jgi:hypothetical protein